MYIYSVCVCVGARNLPHVNWMIYFFPFHIICAYQLDNRVVLHQLHVFLFFECAFAYCRVHILVENQTGETQVVK